MQFDHTRKESMNSFQFLSTEDAKEYFSEVYKQLSEGVHIQNDQGRLYQFIEDYREGLEGFFRDICQENLEKREYSGESFYFLSPIDKKISRTNLSKKYQILDGYYLVFSLILVNIFLNEKFFSLSKRLRWSEIESKIKDGEFSDLLQKFLIRKFKSGYTESDWKKIRTGFRKAISRYRKYGWVKKFKSKDADIVFELRASFYRVVLLYQDIVVLPDEFIKAYVADRQEDL